MKKEFKNYFEDKILAKGYEYYKNGLIQNVHEAGGVIVAKIIGSKTYEAFVSICSDESIDAGCSCFYEDNGKYCEHIAGLLYYLEEHDEINTDEKENLHKIINKIDKKELEDFLVDLLESDEKIHDRFRLKFSKLFPHLSFDEYKTRICNAIRISGGRDGFIDYDETWEYSRAMSEIINEATELVSDGYYELAFDIVTCILDSIPNTPIDDSDGSTGIVADDCKEVIMGILNSIINKDEKLLKKILNYVLNELMMGYLSNYGIEIYELLEFYLRNNLYTKDIEDSLVKILESSKTKKYFRGTNRYVAYLIDIYSREKHNEKIIKLLKEYSYDKEVCFRLVDKYLKQKEITNAIDLLKRGLSDERNARFYAERLSQIYYDEKMSKEYKDILYRLLYEFNKYNIEVYKKIKELYSDEDWAKEKKNIINQIINTEKGYLYFNDLLNIYIEEEMYDELFNTIKNKDIKTIISYEKYLLPKYNKELLNIYVEYCKKFAQKANKRQLYKELASNVRHVKNMKDNEDEYEDMMIEIKEQYRNKPAMEDEMGNL